jgi:hypothetical protein
MQRNSNDSDDEEYSRRKRRCLPTTDEEPKTDGGQPVALEERLTIGSKSWGDVEQDKWRQYHRPSYPPCTSARTTLHANDREYEVFNVERYELLFLLQHGRQHPYERQANGYSEGWDGQKVRQENVADFCRAHAILSQTGVIDPFKKWAVQKAMQENLQGFSRYYEGIDGAVLVFSTLYKCDDVEEARNSYLVDEAETMLGVDGEKLVEYVWRKYGDDVR